MIAPDVTAHVDQLRDTLDKGKQAWVSGPGGSGRGTIIRQLVHEIPGIVVVDLPALGEADAGAVLPMLLLSALPTSERQSLARAPLRQLVDAVRSHDLTVIVRVPHSWAAPRAEPHHQRVRTDLAQLSSLRRLLWIVDSSLDPSVVAVEPDCKIVLGSHRVALGEFSEAIDWRGYGDAAGALVRALPQNVLASPVFWRLCVGAIGLGVPAEELASIAGTPSAIRSANTILIRRIQDSPTIATAVIRFLQARRPVPLPLSAQVAPLPEEHETLLTQCLGYGDPIHVSSLLRSWLERALGGMLDPLELQPVHMKLAQHYRTMDGAADPRQVSAWRPMSAWLEKLHHLAHAGPQGAPEWERQNIPRRECYWDRARHLSRVRAYTEAAAVYARCLEKFPDDDYAQHYHAYNLDKSNSESTDNVIDHYAKAVASAPENPWW
ncbi:MAG: hypothetical protein KC431_23300, partial [Myxococcales bacterium]|nr:hypothetical protein [Myxococcales bacterium]